MKLQPSSLLAVTIAFLLLPTCTTVDQEKDTTTSKSIAKYYNISKLEIIDLQKELKKCKSGSIEAAINPECNELSKRLLDAEEAQLLASDTLQETPDRCPTGDLCNNTIKLKGLNYFVVKKTYNNPLLQVRHKDQVIAIGEPKKNVQWPELTFFELRKIDSEFSGEATLTIFENEKMAQSYPVKITNK